MPSADASMTRPRRRRRAWARISPECGACVSLIRMAPSCRPEQRALAELLGAYALEFLIVAAQHIAFGDEAHHPAALAVGHHRQRLGLGGVEAMERDAHIMLRQQ